MHRTTMTCSGKGVEHSWQSQSRRPNFWRGLDSHTTHHGYACAAWWHIYTANVHSVRAYKASPGQQSTSIVKGCVECHKRQCRTTKKTSTFLQYGEDEHCAQCYVMW